MSVPYSLTKTALIIGLAISSAGAYAATEVNLNYQTRLQSRSAPSDVALQARACHSPTDPFTIEFDLKDVNTQGIDIVVTATGKPTDKNFDIFKSDRANQRQSFTIPFEVSESTYRYQGGGQAMARTGTEKMTRATGDGVSAWWPPYDQTRGRLNTDQEDGVVCYAQTDEGGTTFNDNSDPRIYFGDVRNQKFASGRNRNRSDRYYILYRYRAGTFTKDQQETQDDIRPGQERNNRTGFQSNGYRIRNLRTNMDEPYHYWEDSCRITSVHVREDNRRVVDSIRGDRDDNGPRGRANIFKLPRRSIYTLVYRRCDCQ